MTFTAKSDSSMAELKTENFQKMPPTAKSDFSTADLVIKHKKLPAASFMVKKMLSSNVPTNFPKLQMFVPIAHAWIALMCLVLMKGHIRS